MPITRMPFGELPIGARFGGRTIVYQKTARRRYRVINVAAGCRLVAVASAGDRNVYEHSESVYVDCIEEPLVLAILRTRQANARS